MDNKILTEEAKETEKEAGKEVENGVSASDEAIKACLLYTSPSPRDCS